MTRLGQIFTLLLLILSVAFFVASVVVNASHKDLRSQVADFQSRQKSLETTIDELKKAAEVNKTLLAQEQVARRVSLAALQTQLDTEREKNQQANTQLTRRQTLITTSSAAQNCAFTFSQCALSTHLLCRCKFLLCKSLYNSRGISKNLICIFSSNIQLFTNTQ
jgi:hypothetical protein